MQKVNQLIVLLVALTLMTTGCKKDTEVKPKTREELLMGKSWKITALTVNPAVNGSTDVYANTLACINDNRYEFKTGGVLTIDEGPTKCDPADPQTSQGTWSLNADKTQLTMTIDSDVTVVTITELTESTLKGQSTQGIYTLSITYQRQ